MRESREEGNLIKSFEENEKNLLTKEDDLKKDDNKKRNNFIIISILFILIIASIIIALIFNVIKKDSDPDEKIDPKNEIDIISNEEMNKARNAFKQYKYTDTINNSYILDYNLFIPDNYTSNKKYPLIIFIEDASLVGTDKIKSPLNDTIGGPIWATDTEQKKHESFVLVPQYTERIIDDNNNQFYVSEYN